MVAPWCIISNMPKRVSKKNMHNDGELVSPKRNYYGSLADYKESMVEGPPGSSSQTTFDAEGNPRLPQPQFIGNMPEQLAAYNDEINVKGLPAIGGVGYMEVMNQPLEFRGMESVYIKPDFLKEENFFRNDADSVYRRAANRSSQDSRITDHENISNMYRGVVSAADTLSKYFGKPFRVLPSNKSILPVQANSKSLLINVGDDVKPNSGIAGTGSAYIRRSEEWDHTNRMWKPEDKPATTQQDLNVRAADELARGNMVQMNSQNWANTFIHEFGHNLGGAHPHEYRGGSTRNSILSYGAPDTNNRLLPADINYYRTTMGYNQTPQSIRQRIDSTGSILPNAPRVVPKEGRAYDSFLPAPIPKKNKKKDNRR